MAVWKQFLLIVLLVAVAIVGWGAVDPAARGRLVALGVPEAALPQALFLARSDPEDAPGGQAAAGGGQRPGGSGAGGGGQGGGGQGGGGPGAGPGGGGRGGFGGPVTVVAARAEPATTNDRVTAIGTAQAARAVTLFPRSTGMVETVTFTAGDRVEAGAVLVTLDDDAERIALEQAEVTLADARAKVERYDRLASTSAISSVERDVARSELAAAELGVRQARLDLDRRQVLAPFAGTLGLSAVEPGALVSATTEIATLDDRSALKVAFRVPESVAGRVALGQVASATTPARPGETFEGRVSAVGSRIEVDSRTLLVEAEIDNGRDLLRPGMSFLVELRFEGDEHLAVPALAVQWDRDGSFVWRVVDGKAERIAVTIVERNVDVVLVDGPLSAGDTVVVEGVQRLRPGAAVALAGEPAAPPAEASAATPNG
jgi:RND family efflux transporter MFP subunit